MLLTHISLATAGLAATAQAFLVPPELSESDIATINKLPIESYIVPTSKHLNLTCPECPVFAKSKHGPPKIKTGVASHLELAFAVDTSLDYDRLLVNDFEIYPSSDPLNHVFKATLVPEYKQKLDKAHKKEHKKEHKKDAKKQHKKHRKHERKAQTPPLGFSLQVHPVAKDADEQLQLVELDLQIIEVGTNFVDGIPNVHITLVKDASGRLAMGGVEATESQTIRTTPLEKLKECTTLLCKWMAIAKDKFAHFKMGKPCPGKMAATDGSRPPHRHHGDHHGESARHRHHRSWRQLFKNIMHHILLPIAIGIVAGVSVSLIGMMVGTLVVSVWRTFFRRHAHTHSHCRRHSVSHHKAAQKEAVLEEEKSRLLDDEVPPPSYEENDVKQADV